MSRISALLLLLLALPARAQDEADEDATPRAAVRSFLDASRRGHWDEAARVLGHEGSPATGPAFADLPRTAKQLKSVLDSYIWVTLGDLSDAPEGRTDDHLHPNFEELGRVPSPSGNGTEPVRLQRLVSGRWVFATATVARVPVWYEALPDHWLRERLPDFLLRPGPRDVFWWQYIALAVLGALAYVGGRFVGAGIRWVLKFAARRTTTTFDDALLQRLRGPLALLSATLVAQLLTEVLLLTKPAEEFLDSVLSALRLLSLYWGLVKAVELGTEHLRTSPFLVDRPETKAMLPLLSRAAKIALAVIAVVVVLQKLGYPAASLIAGLGIGGLAFALAAQKTVENLFGSVMLSLDQPFRPGDLVKVDDVVGTVENVGLRSTRIRTLERTVVTMPNGRLADMRIESFAPRDRIRLVLTVGISRETGSKQVRAIIDDLQKLLDDHPHRHTEAPKVVFSNLGRESLDLELTAWFGTTTTVEFPVIKQELLLRIMEVVEGHGSALASPTRTVHVASVPEALERPAPPETPGKTTG